MDPTTRYTLRRNTASIMKIFEWILKNRMISSEPVSFYVILISEHFPFLQRARSTEIRRERNGFKKLEITKRCMQTLACENNYWQNIAGDGRNLLRTGRQCAGESGLPFTSTICRCCCGTSLCNAGLYSTCLNGG